MEKLRIRKVKLVIRKCKSERLVSSFPSNSEERLNSSQGKKDEG